MARAAVRDSGRAYTDAVGKLLHEADEIRDLKMQLAALAVRVKRLERAAKPETEPSFRQRVLGAIAGRTP